MRKDDTRAERSNDKGHKKQKNYNKETGVKIVQ